MADVAHDAPGPASPKPGAAALEQGSRADSPDKGKLRVFISYSRDDAKFADQLEAALDTCGFETSIDRHSVPGGEEWKSRLGNLISEADTVVFVLTPTSAGSPICGWEAEAAERLGKRILPVISRPLEGASPPPQLRERNYIFFYDNPKEPGSGFGTGLAKLVAALNTDFVWLREHTRYLQRATEWDRGGRDPNRLLSGGDIAEARAWATHRPKNAPEPTALHLDFIRASEEEAAARLSAQRKQLEAVAAAQAERETALKKAEDAQRKRAAMARIRNVAFVAVSILALLAGWLYWDAKQQRQVAVEQRAAAENQKDQADRILRGATELIASVYHQIDWDAQKQVFAVFQAGADHGNASAMSFLGQLYRDGVGVARDFVKAREWYEKAADRGDEPSRYFLTILPIYEAAGTGRYAEALQRQERLAAEVEASETKDDGKPGVHTAIMLDGVVWRALFAREFIKALTLADRAYALFPDISMEVNRAHALMFVDRGKEAKALYLAHKGETVGGLLPKLWERAVIDDFAKLREAGLTNPMMADIEKELGVSP
jgi:TIR domain/Sel1 repeat